MNRPPRRPVDPARRCMPQAEWPAGDRRWWERAQEPGDILDGGGPASHWAPLTRLTVARGYGRYLTWLAGEEMLDTAGPLAARVRPDRVAAYTRHLLARNAPLTVAGRLGALAMFAGAVAPEGDWGFVRRVRAWSLNQPGTPGGREPKAARLRHSRELLDLGLELVAQAEAAQAGGRSRHWPVVLRTGLMIALLAQRPLRLRNLVDLRLGEHLLREADGWWLRIPAYQTKNRRQIRVLFPEGLAPALRLYLEEARPLLLARAPDGGAGAGRALWVTMHGRSAQDQGVYSTIVRRTCAVFGRPVNPHLFRDAAATTVALEDPVHVRIAAQVLGHATFATTERHYRLSRSVEAGRAHHAVLARLRRKESRRRG